MSCRDFGGRTVFVTDVDASTGPKRSLPVENGDFPCFAHRPDASNKARNNFLFAGLGHFKTNLRR